MFKVVIFTVLFLFFSAGQLFSSETIKFISEDLLSLPFGERIETFILFKYITMVNPKQDIMLSYAVARSIVRESKEFPFPLELIVGISRIESGFNPFARSHKDARGLMQVHYPTWKRYFDGQRLLKDPFYNTKAGLKVLNYYYKVNNENLKHAIYDYYGAKSKSYLRAVLRETERYKKFRRGPR
ncbi:MAG: lytic transglycosylase domain-containing protein [Nitrospirota bacterium]